MNQADNTSTVSLKDYARVVWMRKWVVAAAVVVCALSAFLLSDRAPRVYEATARLMYTQPAITSGSASSSTIDPNTLSVELQSVRNSVPTPDVRNRATALMGSQASSSKYTVTATVVTSTNSTTGVALGDLVDVTAQAGSPTATAGVANAYAEAVIALRREAEQASISAGITMTRNQLKDFATPQSKLTSDYVVLLQQLRNLQIRELSANGDFSIIVPAVPSSSPVSPKPAKYGALGAGVGLLAGVALAFIIGQFDTRVRTRREAAQIFGLPVIGRLPAVPKHELDESSLIVLTEPHGNMSEAVRVLRSNLEWASIDNRLHSVLVTSCTKGEGKTVTVCNLAVTLAQAGKKVIVVDADLRAPTVHRVFDLPNDKGLTSVCLGQMSVSEAVRPFEFPPRDAPIVVKVQTSDGGAEEAAADRQPVRRPRSQHRGLRQDDLPDGDQLDGNLLVLTSGPLPPNPGEVVASRRFASALAELTDDGVDYVLIDAPPILNVGDAGALASCVDGLIFVTNLEKARRPVLEAGRELLEPLPCRKVGIVTVAERADTPEGHYYYR